MYKEFDYYAVKDGVVAHVRAGSLEAAAEALVAEYNMSYPLMLRGRARGRIQYISISDGDKDVQLWEPEDWMRYSDIMPQRRAQSRRPRKSMRQSG